MKKTVFAITLAFGISGAFAQSMKPVKGEMGIVAGLPAGVFDAVAGHANTGTAMFKYMIADDMAARVGLNFGAIPGKGKIVSDTADFSGGNRAQQTTTITTGTAWKLNLGVQKSMKGTDKLDPYMAIDLLFGGNAGLGKSVSTTDYLKAFGDRAAGDFTKITTTNTKSMIWGVSAVAGMNYFIADHLSLGVELGWGFMNTTSKGGEQVKEEKTGASNTTETFKASPNAKSSIGGLGVTGAALTLSWFFGM